MKMKGKNQSHVAVRYLKGKTNVKLLLGNAGNNE
jgi:hypothetical protein